MNASAIAPGDVAEAESILAQAAARGDALAFAGGGTEATFGYPVERADLVVSTSRLTRVVDYAPADMIVEVEAGCTLAALASVLGEHRQRLAFDPPLGDRATVGGALATNRFGPRRLRFGSLRDLVVGISLVRADGVRVRGGGKVVKNVAGFDLPKICVGSLGSLGLIATATFRLHPIPETGAARTLAACSARDVRELVRATTAAQLEPAAFVARRTGSGYAVTALFEGFASGVDEQTQRFAGVARALGIGEADSDAPGDVNAIDADVRTFGTLRLRLAVPAASFEGLDADALAPLAAAFPNARTLAYPPLGIAFVSADVAIADAAAVAAVRAARVAAESLGGHLVVLAAPQTGDPVDVYGTIPPSFGLMRELKIRFDPDRRCNRGRFLGRL